MSVDFNLHYVNICYKRYDVDTFVYLRVLIFARFIYYL